MTKITIPKAKKKAWEQFSKFVRLRDSLETMHNRTQCKCVTCGSIKDSFGRGQIHAGHFIPGRKNAVLFVEEIVHGQCWNCNYNLNGNWVEYERVMIARYGAEKVEEWKALSRTVVKFTAQDLLDIAEKYRLKIEELGGVPH
jgi:hypothetical protein